MPDPFDIPANQIPPGIAYQWVARTVMGEPHPHYQKMLNSGWQPVRGEKHPGKKINRFGQIEIEGQILMARPVEQDLEARAKEFDKVEDQTQRLAAWGEDQIADRDVSIILRLSRRDLARAKEADTSYRTRAREVLRDLADGKMPGMGLAPIGNGSFEVVTLSLRARLTHQFKTLIRKVWR